ncbi:hypothetical protein Bbelb_244590 [Branchiostoma belcheri]|nr:hypothetical protein Bbelb_244590 [Branchiostoma belcheri]
MSDDRNGVREGRSRRAAKCRCNRPVTRDTTIWAQLSLENTRHRHDSTVSKVEPIPPLPLPFTSTAESQVPILHLVESAPVRVGRFTNPTSVFPRAPEGKLEPSQLREGRPWLPGDSSEVVSTKLSLGAPVASDIREQAKTTEDGTQATPN